MDFEIFGKSENFRVFFDRLEPGPEMELWFELSLFVVPGCNGCVSGINPKTLRVVSLEARPCIFITQSQCIL